MQISPQEPIVRPWNEGNHGEQGNPHPQYQQYVLTTPTNAALQSSPNAQFAQIADKVMYLPAWLSANPKVAQAPTPHKITATFVMQSIYTDSPFFSAILNLRINLYQNYAMSRFSTDITPLTDGDNLTRTGTISVPNFEDLVRIYVTDNGDNSFRIQVFVKYILSYQAWRFHTLMFDFVDTALDYNNTNIYQSYKGYYSYQNMYRKADWFLSTASTTLVAESDATFPVVGTDANGKITTKITNGITKGALIGSSLPTPSLTYQGKLFTVDGGSGDDISYVCVKRSGTYVWVSVGSLIPKYTSLPIADSSWRGKFVRMEGGTGAEDSVYFCKKLSDESYKWVPYAQLVPYFTLNTGNNLNQWTKILSMTVTAQYGFNYARLAIMSGDATLNPVYADLYVRLKQQNAMGTAPIVDMFLGFAQNVAKDNFVAIVSANDSNSTVLDVYMRVNNGYEIVQYIPTASKSTSGSITYTPNSSLLSAPPAGTQIIPTGPGNAISVSDKQITSTSATTVTSFTPSYQGNFEIKVYYRVVTAATNVAIAVSYTDGSGAQTQTIAAGSSQAVGGYSAIPVMINATTGSAITVTATAGTANQVYVSATIKPE